MDSSILAMEISIIITYNYLTRETRYAICRRSLARLPIIQGVIKMQSPSQVIYQIENLKNGHKYVGSTVEKERRWQQHRSKLELGEHENDHLQKSWNKYGESVFEFSVLEKVNETSDLIQREQYYLDILEPEYNIIPKADRSEMSEESKRKMSENHADFTGKNHPQYGTHPTGKDAAMYGKHHTKETKRKISEALKDKMTEEKNPMYGEHHTEKAKEKIRESMPDQTGENNPVYGKHRTKKVKEKISKTMKGRGYTEERKRKNSEAHKGGKNPNSKLTEKKVKIILHLLDGEQFTQGEIGKMFGVDDSAISEINTNESWDHVTI